MFVSCKRSVDKLVFRFTKRKVLENHSRKCVYLSLGIGRSRDNLSQGLQFVVACSLAARSDLTRYTIFSMVVAHQTFTTLHLDTVETIELRVQ